MDLNSYNQHTLKQSILAKGIALHSGEKVEMKLIPADVNTGIIFKRTDPKGLNMVIPAIFDNVTSTILNTGLSKNGVTVSTIEHLMSAFMGMGIDNCLVEINGSEVPVMDGSAKNFVTLIDSAGTLDQGVPRKVLHILKEISVEEDGKLAKIHPYNGFKINFEIDFDNKIIGNQKLSLDIDTAIYKSMISQARTFGMLSEIDQLQKMGLARGGSLDNAIVVQADKVINEEGLRYQNEFVRHKILDAVGDTFLVGGRIVGEVTAVKSGHALNNKLLRKLFSDPTAYQWTDMLSISQAKTDLQQA